ncbi:MAG: hypothetical protein WA691_05715 [Thermoplasmata archaeon]
MKRRALRKHRTGGVVLDMILGAALVILGAFALSTLGYTFQQILNGAGRFFGF